MDHLEYIHLSKITCELSIYSLWLGDRCASWAAMYRHCFSYSIIPLPLPSHDNFLDISIAAFFSLYAKYFSYLWGCTAFYLSRGKDDSHLLLNYSLHAYSLVTSIALWPAQTQWTCVFVCGTFLNLVVIANLRGVPFNHFNNAIEHNKVPFFGICKRANLSMKVTKT